MNIIEMDINEIHEYENNPRDNENAVEYVAESIEKFGFKVPIVVDENNIIITGHTRRLAAMALGMKKVPVIKADDLSQDEVNAFRLADNKVSEFANWDIEKLNEELGNIEMDMFEFGFDLQINDDDDDADDFGEERENGYSITYELAFETEEEQDEWYEFLKDLKIEYGEIDTIAGRVLAGLRAWKNGRG